MKKYFVLIGSLSLLTLLSTSCQDKNKAANIPNAATVPSATTAPTGKIAYVNIDSLEANYEFLKQKRAEFKARQDQMEAELESSYQKMQDDAAEVQKKANAGNLSAVEQDAAQKRLMQMQRTLESRKQTLTDQLLKDQDEFNKDLKKRLDDYLAEYNKDKHYDFILSYSSAGAILYANKALDITSDIIKGMNAQANTNGGDDKKKNK